MGDKRDMFLALGWEKEIRSLGDPHILFKPSSEFEFAAGNCDSDDYELIPFSWSTRAWRWTMHEEQKHYENKENRHEDVPDKDVDLGEDKPKETEHDVKLEG